MRSEILRVIVALAGHISPHELAQMLAVAFLRPGIVLSRVWLVEGPDLHLAGSVGAPTGGGTYSRLDGQFGRIPSGVGKIGQIAQTRVPLVVRSIRGDEEWLANPGWIARQGVRGFLGLPLIAGGQVVGVLAIFDRTSPSDATLAEARFLADYAAARLIDLRERTTLEAQVAPVAPRPVTRADLRLLERQTIEAALAQSRGRVFGPRGAAVLLGMKPTTLASRIKALEIL